MSGNAANFPNSSNILGKIIQSNDTAGPYSETYTISASAPEGAYKHRIGSGLVPAQPATWQNIPKGAFPINPPAAPTLGTPAGYTTVGSVPTNQSLKYLCTFVTDWGETTAGPQLTVNTGTNTSVLLNLPAVGGSSVALVRAIRIYRNTVANPTTFNFVQQINDLRLAQYLDTAADVSIAYNVSPPSTNGSGAIGVVSFQGLTSPQEVAIGSESVAGQFSVDYSTGATGGIITHAPADVGKAVTVTYTASTLASATVMNNIISAIQDMAAELGSNPRGGYSDLTTRLSNIIDSNGRVIPAPVHGVRQTIMFDLDVDGTGDITVDSTHQSGSTGVFSSWGNPKQWSITTTGGDLEVEFMGWPWNYQASTGNWMSMAVCVDLGPAYILSSAVTTTAATPFNGQSATASAETTGFSGKKVFRGLLAGSHTVYLLLRAGGSGGAGVPSAGFKRGSNTSWFSVSIKEIA